MRRRHHGILFSFALFVLIPLGVVLYYLQEIAHDQYASLIGFSVRSEDVSSAQSLLGSLSGLTGLSSGSSSDTDILYEFIQSQTMVARVRKQLDLAALYSIPAYDPVFAYDPEGQFEDLVDYWQRMVKVSYASGSGLIELRVLAFGAKDAHAIAQAIIEECSAMINELSDIARSDATRNAQADLDLALVRLKIAQGELSEFRVETQIIDPRIDLQGQMGLLNSLETQLAKAYIEFNLLIETSRKDDPRVTQGNRRIEVIEELIEQERQKFGVGTATQTNTDYPSLIGEFEQLSVQLKYAQQSYLAAQTVLDTAQAEAQRQSRYLAVYAKPTLPESSRYPERILLSLVIGAFLMMFWSISVLIYYSLRDRR